MKLTKIIPCYNEDKYIEKFIISVNSQPFHDKQIIVVDDGSEDRTDYALELFIDEIVLIKHEKNLGLPAALNKGIKASKANYIVRVDGDDYVNEYFLFLLNQFLEQNKYMDAIACDYLMVDNNEEVIFRKNCEKNPIGCGIMFKSSHLFKIGLYDENFLRHEDKDLRRRFEKKFKIHRIKMPLYRYRRHEHNITNDEKVMDYHLKKLKKKHKMK